MATRRTVPRQVRAQLDVLADALATVAAGETPDIDPVIAFDAAIAAAYDVSDSPDPYETITPVPLEVIARDRVRRLRTDAGITQAAMADLMTRFGFKWHRQTVFMVETDAANRASEVEKGKQERDLTFGEMLAIAALFGVPMVELLLPGSSEDVEVGDGEVGGRRAQELILGRGGKVGTGGPSWGAAASLAPDGVTRPARDLWARRSSKGEK